MLRATDGAAIEGEVWALPTAAIGALLAQVPPPLGFGTVQLADGAVSASSLKLTAVDGGRDITGHGGWRTWLGRQGDHERYRRT